MRSWRASRPRSSTARRSWRRRGAGWPPGSRTRSCPGRASSIVRRQNGWSPGWRSRHSDRGFVVCQGVTPDRFRPLGARMILVCGEALIDLVPVLAGDEPAYLSRAGGSSLNVAMGLGRLGAPVGFLGRVSTGHFGRMLRSRLEADGVDCRFVQEGDEPTTLAVVHLKAGTEPEFAFYGEGTADRMFRAEDLTASNADAPGSRTR